MPTFGLPKLDINPFSTMPLEAGEERQLIGRDHEFLQLKNFLQYRSTRRLMLVGPLGSGRTSMLRCLQPYAASYATVEHLPAHSPGESLLAALHVQLIGSQPPHHWSEMVRVLVNECATISRSLPLVVIDVPASDTSVLSVALRDTLSVLERLNALVVIVCDHHERRQLPSTVTGMFEQMELQPLGVEQVLELVHHRMSTLNQSAPDFNEQQAQSLLDGCDGYPLSVVTALRNAVDSIRMGSQPPSSKFSTGVPAKPMPRDEPYALGVLSGSSAPPEPSFGPLPTEGEHLETAPVETTPVETASTPSSEQGAAKEAVESQHPSVPLDSFGWSMAPEGEASTPSNRELQEPAPGLVDGFPAALLDPLDPEILDASTPWDQRNPSPPSVNAPQDNGFELDFGHLNKQQAQDEPLLPLPTTVSTPFVHEPRSFPPLPKGMFGGLARRNREDTPDELSRHTGGEWENEGLVKEDQDDNSEFWIAPGSMFAEPIEHHDEPMALMEDEDEWTPSFQGNPLESQAIEDGFVRGEDDSQPFTLPHVAGNGKIEEVHAMLKALVMNLHPNDSSSLLSFFEQRQQPSMGVKETHPLNHIALNALNMREAYVIKEARQRWVSPSDATVLEHLDVKRSRLSQICNRLFRLGILDAKRVGRYRKYKLTKAAEAQLTAWGALKEAVA